MKITAIHDAVVPIRSELRNAYISFSEMTVSVVAIHTDVVRNGKPVVGYGFHSNGRYSQAGIIRDRLLPRLRSAGDLVNEEETNFDP
ncbi:MAG: mandelate racemase, partial [Bryobacteraceae bacterium]